MKKQYDIITFHPRRHHNFEQAARIEKYFESFKHLTGLFYSQEMVTFASKFSKNLANNLSRRSYKFQKQETVSNYPFHEYARLIDEKLRKPIDYGKYNSQFARWILKNYAPPKIALGFDTLSLDVFEAWKGKSKLILDLVIGVPHYRAMLDAGLTEYSREILTKRSESDKLLYKHYDRELELADLILCGSDFVKKTCKTIGIPDEKLKVINYGVDVERFDNGKKVLTDKKEGLRFIFIGAVGYRKGADILVEAWQELIKRQPKNELHFYGKVELDFPKNIANLHFHGQVNQAELISDLRKSDILVFPTTFEGSSYSIYQAMASKLAVITTENSGTVLENEKSAIILPIGNPKNWANAMEMLILNPERRNLLAEAAYKKAFDYTWDKYGEKLKEVLTELV